MPVNDVNEVYNVGAALLQNIQSVFAQFNVTLPARQYITIGALGHTAHDSDQLTVSWDLMYTGQPGAQAMTPVQYDEDSHAVTFVVELVRKIPMGSNTGKPPAPSAITSTAQGQLVDARLLFEAGKETLKVSWNKKGIVDLQAGIPQGGLQAVVMNVVTVL